MNRLLVVASAALAGYLLLAVGAAQTVVRFTDVTGDAGISFDHVNGASPVKHLVETMGSGGLFADFDDDGWLDIFLVDGGSLADPAVARQARHRLYRNRGNATFEDVTARSGIVQGDYGMGACAGDIDNDGSIDLYVTSFGANTLYRNRGDGTFVDVTRSAGVGASVWSAGCAFADLDKDGDLDLFVANYVAADRRHSPFCGNAKLAIRVYCHPLNFEPLAGTLYRNDGRGTFTDVSADAGIDAHRGNGLGVIVTDYDEDGWPDVLVANDSMPNFLFRNEGGGRFRESALGAGVAVATDGKARAGMGVAAGDYNGDGRFDVVVTNLDFETHSLYRSLGDGLFAHATAESGIGPATLPFVGFGAAFLDVDNDTSLDLAIVNGHIMDNAPQLRSGAVHAQRKLLFRNTGGRRFVEIGRTAGAAFALERVGRGLATGDVDNDQQRPVRRPAAQRRRTSQRAARAGRRPRGESRRDRRARARRRRRKRAGPRGARRLELPEPERSAPALRARTGSGGRSGRGAMAVGPDRKRRRRRRESDRHDPGRQGDRPQDAVRPLTVAVSRSHPRCCRAGLLQTVSH
jgi:hypothetical protein